MLMEREFLRENTRMIKTGQEENLPSLSSDLRRWYHCEYSPGDGLPRVHCSLRA